MIGKFISGLGIVGVMVLAIFDTHGNSNCGTIQIKMAVYLCCIEFWITYYKIS